MEPSPHDRSDAARLTRWVGEHGGVVRGFLSAALGDAAAADDLLQETFCRAWAARRRYRDDGKERAYLIRIADRLVRDRRRVKRPVLGDDDAWGAWEPTCDLPSPAEACRRNETERDLQAALAELSEPQRRTLLLRYFGNLEFHEIGNILGMPLGTVLSHGRRGLLAMKRLLLEKVGYDDAP